MSEDNLCMVSLPFIKSDSIRGHIMKSKNLIAIGVSLFTFLFFCTISSATPQENTVSEKIKLSQVINDARRLRHLFLKDRYRPGYHFVAPEGFCMPFDANGGIYWRGRFHLFYIFHTDLSV